MRIHLQSLCFSSTINTTLPPPPETRGNAYNPVFHSTFTLPFNANPSPGMLDLVFLRLEVLNARGNLKSAAEEGRGDFVGAYTTGIGGLLSGMVLFSVLFVNVDG